MLLGIHDIILIGTEEVMMSSVTLFTKPSRNKQ